MTIYEQQMLDMGCQDCGENIELYDTNSSGTGGKYRCNKCGRDTFWAVGRSLSVTEILEKLKEKIKSTNYDFS